jgi:RNA polymerase sigma-70 factor, ECF subfamily
LRVVSAPAGSNEDSHDSVPGTLGAILYADRGKSHVLESEWIALVAAIANGDQHALHALYERTHRIVFTLIMRLTRNRQTAEELTLDVFHDVWRRAPTFDPAGGSVVGWIMNQARSRAIDRVRFEQRKKRVNPDGNGSTPEPTTSDELFALMKQEQTHILRNALDVLTPDERRTVETAFFSELTYAQVAEQLHQPLGTVKTRIRSALLKLRQVLAVGVKER